MGLASSIRQCVIVIIVGLVWHAVGVYFLFLSFPINFFLIKRCCYILGYFSLKYSPQTKLHVAQPILCAFFELNLIQNGVFLNVSKNGLKGDSEMEGLKVHQLDKLGGIRKLSLTAGPLSYSNAFTGESLKQELHQYYWRLKLSFLSQPVTPP